MAHNRKGRRKAISAPGFPAERTCYWGYRLSGNNDASGPPALDAP
jgi:hypothetical protein